MKKLLLFLLLLGTSIMCRSQYCFPSFSSTSGYIDQFQLNSLINRFSGSNGTGHIVYPDSAFTTSLTIGSTYFIQMVSSYSGRFSVWIDYNDDYTFSSTELVYTSGNGVSYASDYITIPNDTSIIGLKRIRVMQASYWGSINPCGSYNNGESEDYYINITDSIVIPEYCIPLVESPGADAFIINNFKLNTIHNCGSGLSDNNYILYPDTVFTTDLEIGKTYDVYIDNGHWAGITGGYRVFIDYNNNNVFSSNESVFSVYNTIIASGYITIPNDTTLIGRHRLRVRSGWSVLPDDCSMVNEGETEDYFVNIIPAIIDTTIVPQNLWERTYSISGNQIGIDILETYDKGFIINGATGTNLDKIFLVKTSIDGDILWTKTYNSSYFYQPFSIDTTLDGGFILCGVTEQTDSYDAGFVKKIDACGELQWTKFFGVPGNYDLLTEIYQLPDSGYIASGWYLGPSVTNTMGRIGLVRLDKNGNTIWYNDYTHYFASNLNSFIKTNDHGFLISGMGYVANPGDSSGNAWIRSTLTKIDSAGLEEWSSALGVANHIYSTAQSTAEIPGVGYLTLCSVYDSLLQIYKMSVYKSDYYGNTYWIKPLTPDIFYHYNPHCIKMLNDNLYAITANRYDDCDSYAYRMSVFVIDSSGNVLFTRTFGNVNSQVGNMSITSNNKIIVAGTKFITNNYNIYAFKLNPDLSVDTFYNLNLYYDSICDSINSIPETEVIQNNVQVSVFPNPCNDFTVLKIENYRNQIYEVNIYNSNGIEEHKYSNCKNDNLQIDFKGKDPGVYFAKIRFENNIIYTEKIVVFPQH
jgi:hypothetical protein